MSSSKSFIPCIEESFQGEEEVSGNLGDPLSIVPLDFPGNHPLPEAWRFSKYEPLVGSGNISIGHFELLNEL